MKEILAITEGFGWKPQWEKNGNIQPTHRRGKLGELNMSCSGWKGRVR